MTNRASTLINSRAQVFILGLFFTLFFVYEAVAIAQTLQAETPSDLVPQYLLPLLHADEVQHEIGLSESDVMSLEQWFAVIDGDWFRSRNLPSSERLRAVLDLEKRTSEWMRISLSEEQIRRFDQLLRQAQGTRSLLRADVSKLLQLDAEQSRRLLEAARETEEKRLALSSSQSNQSDAEALKSAVDRAVQAEHELFQSILKPEQMAALTALIGESFDTASLERIYPMAPEFLPSETWINSKPLTLQSLRGQVVLVHYYAFQCSNCQANFKHYNRWQKAYGEKGLKLIGIQTPETASERDPNLVQNAAKSAGFAFPILVDLDAANWNNWANTMWPTVYVIDQRGYLRFWWQGELNWNGATVDAKIEKLIQQLLDE